VGQLAGLRAKRAWVDYAFNELAAAGYSVSSAYTMVKDKSKVSFSYRDNLWAGSDLLATGIASFGHISGVHYQNVAEWEQYVGALTGNSKTGEEPRLPLGRALVPTDHQLLVRELILQLKRGYLRPQAFQEKYGVNIVEDWQDEWRAHEAAELIEPGSIESDEIRLTRKGLLQVDGMLPSFFEAEHQGVRYT